MVSSNSKLSILYCTILYYTVLYRTIPYYTVLYRTILYYTILYCTYCTIPYDDDALNYRNDSLVQQNQLEVTLMHHMSLR